jgi:3D (Asp-Asp-Asp) domain-containing protein
MFKKIIWIYWFLAIALIVSSVFVASASPAAELRFVRRPIGYQKKVTSKVTRTYRKPFLGINKPRATRRPKTLRVRTTAYTHTESDHRKYRKATAAGTTLKYGSVRSAAADWSRFPVGTVFKINGDSSTYVVEDYGSALVGTSTIDLYKPSRSAMNNWGVRHVDIQILKMGCFDRSLRIMKDRRKNPHVRTMYNAILAKS